MPNPTKPADQERPGTPTADDDAGVTNIPQDQVHPALSESPHPDQKRLHTVQINGQTEEWTTDKLIAEAQKSAAAQQKFQEAAELRKDAARALGVEEDMKAVFEGGEDAADALRRIGVAFGTPGDKVEEVVQRVFGDEDEDENVVDQYYEDSRRTSNRTRQQEEPQVVDYSKLSPDLQRIMRENEKARMDKIVGAALDNDKVIAYNMENLSPEGQAAIRRYVDREIQGRLPKFGGDFGDGTRILAEVLPEIREHLEALGIPGKRTNAGLGPAPGGGDAEVYPTKKPDHVPSTDGQWEQHILEDLAYNQAQAERARRT